MAAARSASASVRLDTAPDAHGTPFTLVVNDVPVFVRGRQLDPRRRVPDPGHPGAAGRAASARRPTRTSTCCGSGAAAGTSRTTSTTSPTSSGLLVRQDFLFACAAYPEEEPFARRGRGRGARAGRPARRRTRAWCSWTGNNENIWGFARLGLAGAARRAHLGAPATTSTCCPGSSPSSTRPGRTGRAARTRAATTVHPNDPAHGTMHIWDVWNTDDYTQLPRVPAPVRRRVRLPGARRRTRRCAGRSPTSRWRPTRRACATTRRRSTATGSSPRGLAAHLPRAARLRRLALPDPAQPGPGDPARGRALPVAAGRLHGRHRLAAQRLLAGHLVGGGRRRRPAQAAVVRAAPGVRRPAAHRPAARRRAGPGGGQRRPARRGAVRPTVTRVDPGRRAAGEDHGRPRRAAASARRRWRCRRTLARPDEARPRAAGRRGRRRRPSGPVVLRRGPRLAYPPAALRRDGRAGRRRPRVRVTARTVLRDLSLFPDRLDPRRRWTRRWSRCCRGSRRPSPCAPTRRWTRPR